MKKDRKQRVVVEESSPQATSHSLTRRRFLETSLIAGTGTLLGTTPFARAQRTRLVNASTFYKGMCYQPFPAPYDPSTANTTCIFFGSDIAYDCMEPLWGKSFTSHSGQRFLGRNDLATINLMGANLIRLYDWEPRNYHKNFLDYCQTARHQSPRIGLELLPQSGSEPSQRGLSTEEHAHSNSYQVLF